MNMLSVWACPLDVYSVPIYYQNISVELYTITTKHNGIYSRNRTIHTSLHLKYYMYIKIIKCFYLSNNKNNTIIPIKVIYIMILFVLPY